MDPIYYLITFVCVAGGCYTGFQLGRREGIEHFLAFLDAHKNRDNKITIKLENDQVEIV